MTHEIVAAMDEYLQTADSLERWDLTPDEARPLLEALGIARRRLLDQLSAFERWAGRQGPPLAPRAVVAAAHDPEHFPEGAAAVPEEAVAVS